MFDIDDHGDPFSYESLGLHEVDITADEYDGESCIECKQKLNEELFFSLENNYYCYDCADKIIGNVSAEATEYAREQCNFTTTPLPTFNPLDRSAPTPEEYEAGIRDAYTENSFRCQLRHRYTNYDELIGSLAKDSLQDRIYYAAIRHRIDEMTSEDSVDGLTRYPWETESEPDKSPP